MNEQTIFTEALERAPDDRMAFLREACGSDQSLRERIDRLLRLHDSAGQFLDRPAAALKLTVEQRFYERPGVQIGPYKLLQQIASQTETGCEAIDGA